MTCTWVVPRIARSSENRRNYLRIPVNTWWSVLRWTWKTEYSERLNHFLVVGKRKRKKNVNASHQWSARSCEKTEEKKEQGSFWSRKKGISPTEGLPTFKCCEMVESRKGWENNLRRLLYTFYNHDRISKLLQVKDKCSSFVFSFSCFWVFGVFFFLELLWFSLVINKTYKKSFRKGLCTSKAHTSQLWKGSP